MNSAEIRETPNVLGAFVEALNEFFSKSDIRETPNVLGAFVEALNEFFSKSDNAMKAISILNPQLYDLIPPDNNAINT